MSTTFEDGREPVDDEAVSTAIVREVARREGVPAVGLDSIYDVINPDALEELFSP
ncbi:HalOD1 output domain-containing protein [Haladaptatus halobius]|uniref:HalOD1 output domain-containing protein n=1 Tax=Haladaptatus halobius TaxID=2884875 RepID=UPI001D09DC70|nr:HalOD1 output domain-containing protein [Haladaptatus halobius]